MSQMNATNVNSHYGRLGRMSGGRQASSIVLPMDRQHIPIYKTHGYNALTHNNAGSGKGYFTVKSAYDHYNKGCSQVIVRDCNGNVTNENFEKCNKAGCAPYSQSGENPGNFGKMDYALGFDHHACEQAKKDKTNPLNC